MSDPRGPSVAIVDTGRSNAASVAAALERAGARPFLSVDPEEVRLAPFAVLPGVGAFGAVMDRLRAMGLDSALRERVDGGLPTLGACLGMQLFFESSEESPGARGIGAIPGALTAFGPGLRSPQFGWNRLSLPKGLPGGMLAGTALAGGSPSGDPGPVSAYFANSFKLDRAPAGWTAATARYGESFVAAIERGPVLLCQFHPELSGSWGRALLARWLAVGSGALPPASAPASVATEAGLGGGPSSGASSTLPRIIPCLDVRDGRVVKGVRFRGMRDSGDPAELAARYEAAGADEIVLLDIGAGVEGRDTAVETVRAVRSRLGIPLCVGGGIRVVADAERALAAGADKVSLNSMGYRNPALLSDIAREFGRQCCVAAVDATRKDGTPVVVLDAGRTETATACVDWIRRAVDAGAGEILLTSRDRDGTRSGYDLELLRAACSAVPGTPVIASGGAASPEQILDGLRAGADAALLAGALHDGTLTVTAIKDYLRLRGAEVR
ncbi:MAG: imidazole glycerol phosphate synthase subunit HisH [Spirochaetes bacterium]|nr:imidazole glycerol phosphate synthase subunit HisH [Spirochaetota bacterium]MBU1081854.1 imidazole glycerol phosphate synthase subunit HisH [Spirochaetota bacterium]